MTDPWSGRLSDYLDGDLTEESRAALTTHLTTCAACRNAVEELRGIRDWARTYEAGPPPSDPWPAVARELHRSRRPGWGPRRSRMLAAAAAIVVTTGLGVWATLDRNSRPPAAVLQIDAGYTVALEDLADMFAARRSQIDLRTLQIIEQSLAAIDSALRQIREALDETPDNALLRDLLVRSQRQKMGVLRNAANVTLTKS